MKKIIILLSIFLLSSCTSIKIQDYIYPISIGIDYKEEKYEIYLQLVSHSKLSKTENESSYDESYEMIILKKEGNTVYEALSNLHHISKNHISTTHIRSFIIGSNLIKTHYNYLNVIRSFFDNNYLRSNINIFSCDNIMDIYKAGKIIDNTPYSNEINNPNNFHYLKPMNYLNFLKNVYDNRTSYLPFATIDKESTSYVESGEIKENYIIKIDGAYFINTNNYKYINNDLLIGNYYFIDRKLASFEIKDKLYIDIRKLEHSIDYKENIIFTIKLKNATLYLEKITYDEALRLINEKIKKEINFTYQNCYDEIDIFHLNDYKNRYNINNAYQVEIEIKHPTINYSSIIK